MPAGKLRNRVTFQAETQISDGGGGYQVGWGDVVANWSAEFLPERGRERIEAGRLAAPMGGTLKVRWSSETAAITEQHRVLIDGVPWNIRSVANEDRRHRFVTMTVEKGVAT